MSTTPPGWYDDGSGTQRWWDGSAWTEHVQAAAAAGGYPGDAASVAPDHSATYQQGPPQPAAKSKLWIVFVVLGVIVVALIVLAAVFIPRLIGQIAGAGGSSAGDDAERAAVQVVERYDDAWDDADCDLYFETTTEGYREALGMTDCAAFESTAEVFDESTDEYEIQVDTVERTGENIAVLTSESYLSLVDENGDPRPTPEPVAEPLQYTLVPAGDGWAIDDVQ
ncbi:DUF2510 domain-containing protein [Microbacterium pullorum]|uniref:DUF2510 domain-containing protein n=1 Tax=Microbacterium pullorum TaxID=2762236 RepID=UPI001CD8D930|nr:DUF2510 domain-containing protein [Microbacterium pullorum]